MTASSMNATYHLALAGEKNQMAGRGQFSRTLLFVRPGRDVTHRIAMVRDGTTPGEAWEKTRRDATGGGGAGGE